VPLLAYTGVRAAVVSLH